MTFDSKCTPDMWAGIPENKATNNDTESFSLTLTNSSTHLILPIFDMLKKDQATT